MPEIKEASVETLAPSQAADLCQLADLEACWENLRKTPSLATDVSDTREDLHGRQRAYEVFRGKLAAYNQLYKPAHVPELLLNTPTRLGVWCRRMRDLYLLVETDARVRAPAYLLEKAYRWADRVSLRMNRERVNRSAPPASVQAAIQELEAVARWCDELAKAAEPISAQAG
jgi:hypothetical protein